MAVVGFGGITLHAGALDNEWTNMPGVMGMAFPTIAGVWLKNTVFDSIVDEGELANVFSLCLGSNGGHLTIGGINSSLYTGEIEYSPLLEEEWYVLNITDVGVNGQSLGLPSSIYNKIAGGTIVDSGTYNLVINGDAYDVLFAIFLEMCSTTDLIGVCSPPANETLFAGYCFEMTQSQIDAFPNITITVDNVRPLNIQGKYYLLRNNTSQYCLGIQSSGIGGFTILGNVFQQPFYIVFNRQGKSLGFADASPLCNTGFLA